MGYIYINRLKDECLPKIASEKQNLKSEEMRRIFKQLSIKEKLEIF